MADDVMIDDMYFDALGRRVDDVQNAEYVERTVCDANGRLIERQYLSRAGSMPERDAAKAKRFHGTVTLDPARVGRDAGRIADEVISHLAGLAGSRVNVTLEIEAEVPSGVPDPVVRTVTENSRTLKFVSHGFEAE